MFIVNVAVGAFSRASVLMQPAFWRSIRAMRTPARTASIAALLLILGVPARAEVVRFVVEERQAFASKGIAYEKLTGRFYGQLDPRHKLNAIITDIELAPRNDRGMVEYSATFIILKPVDMDKSTGVIVYQVPNRGRQTMEGGGFYADFRSAGHTLVASGWQADIAPGPGVESMVTPIGEEPGRLQHHRPGDGAIPRHACRNDHPADRPWPRDWNRHAGELRHDERPR